MFGSKIRIGYVLGDAREVDWAHQIRTCVEYHDSLAAHKNNERWKSKLVRQDIYSRHKESICDVSMTQIQLSQNHLQKTTLTWRWSLSNNGFNVPEFSTTSILFPTSLPDRKEVLLNKDVKFCNRGEGKYSRYTTGGKYWACDTLSCCLFAFPIILFSETLVWEVTQKERTTFILCMQWADEFLNNRKSWVLVDRLTIAWRIILESEMMK